MKLSDFKGKHVVLEWTNPAAPFVQKHYNSNNMQSLQKDATAKGVVWLSVNSTNKSATDYLEPTKLNAKMNGEWKGASSYLLMDETGKAGMAYEAKTTPHMYVIDPNGKLVYAGGIDDKRSANPADVKTRRTLSAPRSTKRWPASRSRWPLQPCMAAASSIRNRPLASCEKARFSRVFHFHQRNRFLSTAAR